MREILFRAKRLDNGEWVEGDGIHYPKSFNWKGTCWIDGMHERANDWVQVDPKTVRQYTGRTDKNGVKIFEGDIVKDDVIFGAVVWDKPYVGFVIDDVHAGHQEYSWWHELEVIGNIFDNMELLKGGGVDDVVLHFKYVV